MWPKRREWARWNALNKASYVAQLMAPVALVVSGVFSYLSWIEARRGLEIQERMFAAQNGPSLKVSSVQIGTVSDGRTALFVAIKNVGESDAVNMCFSILDFEMKYVADTCEHDGPFRSISVPKGEVFRYTLPIGDEQRRRIGFVPGSASVMPEESQPEACPAGDGSVVIVFTDWKDVLGNSRGNIDQLLLCAQGQAAGGPRTPATRTASPESVRSP